MTEQLTAPLKVYDLAFAVFAARELGETDDPSFEGLVEAALLSDVSVEVPEDVAKYAFWMARKYGFKHRDARYDEGHAVGSSIRAACVPRGIYPG